MAVATFAAGCFWGVEQRFSALSGVTTTEVGYTGGTTPDPTYRQVCSHSTGHAEAVRLEYDPGRISYEELLHAFFDMHDPTTRDRQGPDIGSQYRSAIFYHSVEQEQAARAYVSQLESSGAHGDPIVTEIVEAPEFWRAEDYHQRYFEKHRVWGCAR
jgi:methionine-S-sulfoxide reductase